MNNRTEIIFVIDESGSMSHLKKSTIDGFNGFIKEQKAIDGEAFVSLVVFSTQVKKVFESIEINNVKELNSADYNPSGLTSLFDAVGMAIDSAGNRFDKMNNNKKPNNVMVVIITDGAENASREYSQRIVKEKITHQTEKYGWQFIFLGANIDSASVAGGIGIAKEFARNYTCNAEETQSMYSAISKTAVNYRKEGILNKSDLDSIK